MRQDKLTTKFQQALADAQSLAVGHDNQMIEPVHLLLALLQQEDGSTSSLLAQAGTNVQALKTALDQAIDRLPRVEGHGGEVQIGRDLIKTAAVAIERGRLAGECLPALDDHIAEGLRQFEAIHAAAGLLAGDQL